MPALSFSAFNEIDIAHQLGDVAHRFQVDILEECPSTNTEMLSRARNGAPSGTVLVAKRQTAGRGRRGRTWYATPDSSLTFSLLWRFPPTLPLNGLTLAVGLALAEAIGVGAEVKWPNDVLFKGRKLAGVLVEMANPHTAVIGIGLNLVLPPNLPPEVARYAAALPELERVEDDRTSYLARILRALLPVLERFTAHGFSALQPAWQARNAFQNQPVCLIVENAPERTGICRGADNDGALLLETAQGVERILSGDISVRPS